jgi:2-polyprenyl-6-hydroxyphenyl methylase/3-demethylubiquinone-9 3-methyltransferase
MPNADPSEIEQFDDISSIWWDKAGEMGTLHTINPLRLRYILSNLPTPNVKIADIGCGGGILSEALALAGAEVTGIDLSPRSIEAAMRHAQTNGVAIDYRLQSAEDLAAQQPAAYHAITCMEMLEHVPNPAGIVEACAQALKPGGNAFFSSVNRTPKAWLLVIIGGEFILRLLPRGSHHYRKLIKPSEIRWWAEANGLIYRSIASLIYNPLTRRFKVTHGIGDVNYMMHFKKPE